MTEHVEPLVEALRLELQHYGELLALLDAEASAGPTVVTTLDAIQRHGALLGTLRQQRFQAQSQLASAIAAPGPVSLPALLPGLPAEYQPLLRALAEEIDDLIARVRERARLNHARLHHAADQLEGLIDAVATPAPTAGDRPVPLSFNA